jgi:hypothetical protein
LAAADLKRLTDATDFIERHIVNPRVRDIEISFLMQVAYVVLLFVLGIVANLSPNIGTMLGALGLGSLGVAGNYQRIQGSVNKLLVDRRALKDFVGLTRTRIALCDENDMQSITEVRTMMLEGLKTLGAK